MPMTPGLGLNLRQPAPETDVPGVEEMIVEVIEDNDNAKMDENGNILEIKHADG